jgi:hypothetical protein
MAFLRNERPRSGEAGPEKEIAKAKHFPTTTPSRLSAIAPALGFWRVWDSQGYLVGLYESRSSAHAAVREIAQVRS